MSEEQADYLNDALDMIGVGYHPAVEIEQSRTVIQRRGGRLEEFEKPAFVKLSTDFKYELAEISGDALKVWLYISLSINRRSGRANPGLRTIADGVGRSVNTVQKALAELEKANLLAVFRGERRYNLYEIPEYVSANRAEPTVSNRDTDAETVSNSDTTVSKSAQTVSPSVILNQSNQKNQNNGADAPLSAEEIEQAGEKVRKIIELSTPKGKAWKGRDLLAESDLPFADWYHETTGQVMTKAVSKSWRKAFLNWRDEGVTLSDLQEAYDANKWRLVNDPNMLTKDARAIHALGNRPVEPMREEGKSSGYYG